MKKKAFLTCLKTVLLSLLVLSSCENKSDSRNDLDDQLIGTWTDTIMTGSGGHDDLELSFSETHAFTEKSYSHRYYSGRDEVVLDSWHISTGNYYIDGNKLALTADRTIYCDNFYCDVPDTITAFDIVFENCTYEVSGDSLKLNYTTYPNDRPATAVRIYLKKK